MKDMALNICKIIIIARELQISWWRTQQENLDAKAVNIINHYLRISIYASLYISSVQLCRWILYGRFFDPVSKARVRLRVNYIIPEFFFLLLKDQNQTLAPKNSKKKKKKESTTLLDFLHPNLSYPSHNTRRYNNQQQ